MFGLYRAKGLCVCVLCAIFFCHQNPGFELNPDPYPDPELGKMPDPDLDPHQINADPQPPTITIHCTYQMQPPD